MCAKRMCEDDNRLLYFVDTGPTLPLRFGEEAE
jgi:hypothetical protein